MARKPKLLPVPPYSYFFGVTPSGPNLGIYALITLNQPTGNTVTPLKSITSFTFGYPDILWAQDEPLVLYAHANWGINTEYLGAPNGPPPTSTGVQLTWGPRGITNLSMTFYSPPYDAANPPPPPYNFVLLTQDTITFNHVGPAYQNLSSNYAQVVANGSWSLVTTRPAIPAVSHVQI